MEKLRERLKYYLENNASVNWTIYEAGRKAPLDKWATEGDGEGGDKDVEASLERLYDAIDYLPAGRYMLKHSKGKSSGIASLELKFEIPKEQGEVEKQAINGIEPMVVGMIEKNNEVWEQRLLAMQREYEQKEKEREHREELRRKDEEIKELKDEVKTANSWEEPVGRLISGVVEGLSDNMDIKGIFGKKKSGSENISQDLETMEDADQRLVSAVETLQEKLGDDFLTTLEKLSAKSVNELETAKRFL